jgi:dienelactone hydrolase
MIKAAVAGAMLALAFPASSAAQTPSQTTPIAVEETAIAGFPHAILYRLPGAERRPVVVILAGAEGGDEASKRFGPLLARLGYAAVGLPYYSPNWGSYGPPPQFADLPGSFIDIRVDQLADLRTALTTSKGVDTGRFGLFAGSKGSEFALIAASQYSWIDVVVAYAPSDLVWEGWGLETLEAEGTRSSFSLGGKPLPFMPYRGFVEGLQAGPKADLRAIHENGRADHPDRETAARIPAENYRGKLMLVAGDRDQLWNSGRMSRNIVAARDKAGLATTTLLYPDAGHDLGGGSAEPRDDPRGGGTPEANAKARADAWPQVVAFLKDALRP